uniref:14 kDa phosphohistidine phosphatase n=1 Tax=Seriola dumerili TaxID=41447 RepID=A0A3B4U7A3_SERDU
MCTQTKAAALMANIPQADIDPSGVFKYVLIRVHSREEGDDSEIDIVRGYGWAEYHADIYDKVSEELEKDGHLDCECIGGGRIKHDAQAKKIHVYGYSMVRESCRKTLNQLITITLHTVIVPKKQNYELKEAKRFVKSGELSDYYELSQFNSM